jgi:aminoglycoside phosphotransferase (APT) family kinase protein
MSEIWSAEEHVGEELARRLVRAQFQELPADEVTLVSEGWDYAVFRVDVEWAFRFPRREMVVPGTEREIAVLPHLAPRLPASVPVPVFVGEPSDLFPWPFYGARFIPGEEPTGLADDARSRLARPLARFLRALHETADLDLPVDLQQRSNMAFRVPRTRQELEAIAHVWRPPPRVEEVLREAEALPLPDPVAVVHGDLHFRQLLVHEDELRGVIDWVDVCRADPGQDLQLVWSFLPPSARSEFLDEYGPVAEHSLLRARVLALNLMAALVRYAHHEGFAAIEAEALAGLERAAVD